MHELSICHAICGIATRRAEGRRVDRVCIDIGSFRQVVPQTLVSCWEIVVAGTDLAGSALDVNHIPATAECATCGRRSILDDRSFRCPECDGTEVTVISGNELRVTSIVVEED